MFKKNNGITIIALIITIIIMLILVGVSFKLGTDAVDKARLEDIKTNMLSIQTKAKIIEEKKLFGDIPELSGYKIDLENWTYNEGTKAINNENLINNLSGKENLYVWDKDILKENNLSNIEADGNKYYIVYYDTDNATCEIYYSLGYKTKDGKTIYSLTEMQDIQ